MHWTLPWRSAGYSVGIQVIEYTVSGSRKRRSGHMVVRKPAVVSARSHPVGGAMCLEAEMVNLVH